MRSRSWRTRERQITSDMKHSPPASKDSRYDSDSQDLESARGVTLVSANPSPGVCKPQPSQILPQVATAEVYNRRRPESSPNSRGNLWRH